ncbi:sugar transferase [Micromonospora coerulea]|uniref:sugar transferase n=1 Tax=Micromonospora coerulea TaxID=47856 RepID=UPI0019069CEC|nr:sugar transferase [Micromonospora veneta]
MDAVHPAPQPPPARQDGIKRLVDVVGAAVLLILALPALLVVAGLVAAGLGRPVLFRQARAGRYGRPFELVKFRTMHPPDPRRGRTADGDRLTRLGRWLRATSLDELPTLWNVLCGDMSLVGPRPLLCDYLDRYSPTQSRRHEVRPGITGLAQVRGRNALGWEEKFEHDVWYVDHRSLRLDLTILAETARTVLRREGITAEGAATAPEFRGSRGWPGQDPEATLPRARGNGVPHTSPLSGR